MKHLMLAAAAVLVFSSQACAYSYGPSWGVTFSLGVPAYAPPPPPPPRVYGYSAGYAQGYAQGYANGNWNAYVPPPPPRYHHRHNRGYYRGW